MLYVIAYDICNAVRLRRVAKTCLDYGIRIEKSIFECDLDDDAFAHLWHCLGTMIVPGEDALIAYRICRACADRIRIAGAVCRPEKPLVFIP